MPIHALQRGLSAGTGFVLCGILVVAGCSTSGSDGPATTTTSTPNTTTTLPADAAEVISTNVAANSALVAGGALWVAGTEDPDETGGDTLLRLDLATAQVISSIDVGGFPLGLATTDGLVWVTTSEGLARVDIATEEVATVALGGAGRAMAASETTVWVDVDREFENDVEITAVDATSLETRTFAVADVQSLVVPDLATDGATLWVSVDDWPHQSVVAFDAVTDEPIESFEDPWADDSVQAVELNYVDGELWICGRPAACIVADPATGEVLRDVSFAVPEGELRDLIHAEGSLWASIAKENDGGEDEDPLGTRTTTFLRIDPETGLVLGPLYEAAYPVTELAVGEGTAFLVASANESRVPRELVLIDLD